ncbi:NACHT domain-containing protein [Saccharopolyspora shandongensis]|uniref:NACHT domain-containing protein n=1 Tax=Saccharopolyspora shandongensis TaxID=418495 RepID=UPI0033CD795C
MLLPTAINIGTGGTAPAFLAPYTGWTWPVIGVLWAVSVAVGLWEMLARQQSAITSRPVDHPRNRPNALDRVEHYVDQRFSQSLAAKARIELDLDERPDAVIRPQSLTVQPVGGAEKAIASNAPISEVFDELHQSMLILGDPGAGKTTLLLELARALVERARQDAEQPIPVLVDLSGWPGTDDKKSGPNDFVQWLRDELRRRYTIPHAVTDAWLAAGKLALLLDGLDEVAPAYREECVRELNSLPQKVFVPQIAVCSRLGEYDRLPERLSLHGAVRIQPLTRDRLAEYFEGTGRGLSGVRSMLTSDPELWELLDSPLMLNIMFAGALVAALLGIAVASPPDTRFLGFAVGLVIGGCGLLAWDDGPGASLLGLLVFRFTGYLPPRRRDFLSHAADRSLLSRSDGEWRFVHLLVRDHLAECDPALLGTRAEQRARELAGNRSRQAA